MKIGVLFDRYGPYHLARVLAAKSRGGVVAVEVSPKDPTYAWSALPDWHGLERYVAFPEDDFSAKPVSEIVSKVSRTLDSSGADVIAIPGWSGVPELAALLWALNRRIPAILMSDSTAYDASRRWLTEAVKRRIVECFGSALVAGTDHRSYLEGLGMSHQHVFEGFDAIDNEYFASAAASARANASHVRATRQLPENYLLASARFVEKKNLVGLVRGFSHFASQPLGASWHLVILGDGPLRGAIAAEARERGVAARVHLPGFVQYDDLPEFYGLARAFVHASLTEQWGLVVNEAMASGLPVLVSKRCGCARDLVQDGVNGYTFKPDDPQQIARCMLKITGSAESRAAMGARSSELIARFSLAGFSDGLWKAASAAMNADRRQLATMNRVLLHLCMRRHKRFI